MSLNYILIYLVITSFWRVKQIISQYFSSLYSRWVWRRTFCDILLSIPVFFFWFGTNPAHSFWLAKENLRSNFTNNSNNLGELWKSVVTPWYITTWIHHDNYCSDAKRSYNEHLINKYCTLSGNARESTDDSRTIKHNYIQLNKKIPLALWDLQRSRHTISDRNKTPLN